MNGTGCCHYTEWGSSLCIDEEGWPRSYFKKKGAVQCHSMPPFFNLKKCACVCIDYLRKEIPCNLAMVVTRHLLGMGKRQSGELGWEENLIITLYSFIFWEK